MFSILHANTHCDITTFEADWNGLKYKKLNILRTDMTFSQTAKMFK